MSNIFKIITLPFILILNLVNINQSVAKDMPWFYADFSRLQNDIVNSKNLSENEQKFNNDIFNQIQELFAELEHYNDLKDLEALYKTSKYQEEYISNFIKDKRKRQTERIIRLIEMNRKVTLEQMSTTYNNFNSLLGNNYVNDLNDLFEYLKKNQIP